MGHGRPGEVPHDHVELLSRRARYHRRLRLHRPGVFQQRQTVAAGNRPLCLRERQQAAGRQQVRPDHQKSRRLQRGKS